jgi:hypothetical protein
VTLLSVPNELHLEILRRLDVVSIFAMRDVNRHFRGLVNTNQDTILRASLANVECVGVHRILLTQLPSPNDMCTLAYARRIHATKKTMIEAIDPRVSPPRTQGIPAAPSAASCRDGPGCPNSRLRVPSWSPSAKACFHCQSKTESGNLGKSR